MFFGFPRVFGQLGLGQQKPQEKPNKPKKQKTNPEWTYPRFFSQDCFFLFSSSFWTVGLGTAKTSRKTKQTKKNKKHNAEWTYTRFFSQDCFFVYLVFLEFLDSKNLKKNQINKKTILNGLTQDSSHRIVFLLFWFSSSFWTFGKLGMEKGKKTKHAKTQRSQRLFLIT